MVGYGATAVLKTNQIGSQWEPIWLVWEPFWCVEFLLGGGVSSRID